jgi:molybdopterin/thiamine biosynthesis adenylyltransferase
MSSEISNRHRGDLGGRLTDIRVPGRVIIAVSSDVATNPAAQHLAWMLANLLSRQTVEIQEIQLQIPDNIKVTSRLTPLIPNANDFLAGLRTGIQQINPGVLLAKRNLNSTVFIRVGPGLLHPADFTIAASSNGWSGGISRQPVAVLGESLNPIGPYVAASLCAGEVFKFVRGVRSEAGDFANQLWLDATTLTISTQVPAFVGFPSQLELSPTILAGVGAVANAFLHVLYAADSVRGQLIMIDNDPEGVTHSNLNRYVLFGLSQISQPKASAASAMFSESGIEAVSIDQSWQDWISEQRGIGNEIVISAVDRNSARHAIQDALPRMILGASTNEMRAQVNLYDVINGTACLKCRNPIESQLPDESIVAQLRGLRPSDLASRAVKLGVDVHRLREFLDDPLARCGQISGSTLRKFAAEADEVEWSVGFVSALAGVILAAEYLKLALDLPQSSLSAKSNAFRFQFWRPQSAQSNRLFSIPADPKCICQTEVFRTCVAQWTDDLRRRPEARA